MNSMRTYLVLWLSGLIAGLVLMERWRRRGEEYVPMDEGVPGLDEESSTDAAASRFADKPNVVGLVVNGAKLDVERVRHRLRQAKQSRSDTASQAPPSA